MHLPSQQEVSGIGLAPRLAFLTALLIRLPPERASRLSHSLRLSTDARLWYPSPPPSHHSPPPYPPQTHTPAAVPPATSNAPELVLKRMTALENTLNDFLRNKVGSSRSGVGALLHQSPHVPSPHPHPPFHLPPVNIPSSPPSSGRHQYSTLTSAAQPSSLSAGPPEISNIMSLLSAPPPNRGSGSSGSSGPGASVTLGASAGIGHRHTVSSSMPFSPSPRRYFTLANGTSYCQPPTSDYRDQRPASRGHTSEIEEDELAMEDIEET